MECRIPVFCACQKRASPEWGGLIEERYLTLECFKTARTDGRPQVLASSSPFLWNQGTHLRNMANAIIWHAEQLQFLFYTMNKESPSGKSGCQVSQLLCARKVGDETHLNLLALWFPIFLEALEVAPDLKMPRAGG